MKVLVVNDFKYEGGAEKVFRDTCDLLSQHVEIRPYYASEHHQTAKNPLTYLYSKKQKTNIYKELSSFSPDIIHVHVFSHLLTPSIFSAIRHYKKHLKPGLRVIYTAHDFNLICPNSGYLYFKKNKAIPLPTEAPTIFKMLMLRLDKRSSLRSWLKKVQWIIGNKLVRIEESIDVIVTPSTFLKEVIQSAFANASIEVIRNPVEIHRRSTSGKNTGNTFRIVYFGRLSEEKGMYEFIANISTLDLNYTIDIIGDGPEKDKIQQLVLKKGLSKKISMLGKMDHLSLTASLSTDYDAMVLPSLWYENAPVSLVEGAMAGLAILGSDMGGIKEISNICGNNFLFNPYDSLEIHQQIKTCFETIKADNLKVRSLDEFSQAVYTGEMIKLYRSLSYQK